MFLIRHMPVQAVRTQQIVQRRGGECSRDRSGCDIPNSDKTGAVLVAIFERPKEPGSVLLDRSTQCECILFAIKWRRLTKAPVKGGWQTLQRFVSKIDRGRPVKVV